MIGPMFSAPSLVVPVVMAISGPWKAVVIVGADADVVEVVELGADLPGAAERETFLQGGELVDVPWGGGPEDALEIGVGLEAGDE